MAPDRKVCISRTQVVLRGGPVGREVGLGVDQKRLLIVGDGRVQGRDERPDGCVRECSAQLGVSPRPEPIAQPPAIEVVEGNLGPVLEQRRGRSQARVLQGGIVPRLPLLQHPLRVEVPGVEEHQRRLVAGGPVVAEPGMDVGRIVLQAGAEDVTHQRVKAKAPLGLRLQERGANQLLPAAPAQVVTALVVEIQGRAFVEPGRQAQFSQPLAPRLARERFREQFGQDLPQGTARQADEGAGQRVEPGVLVLAVRDDVKIPLAVCEVTERLTVISPGVFAWDSHGLARPRACPLVAASPVVSVYRQAHLASRPRVPPHQPYLPPPEPPGGSTTPLWPPAGWDIVIPTEFTLFRTAPSPGASAA